MAAALIWSFSMPTCGSNCTTRNTRGTEALVALPTLFAGELCVRREAHLALGLMRRFYDRTSCEQLCLVLS